MFNENQLKLWQTGKEAEDIGQSKMFMSLEEVIDCSMQCISPLSLQRPNGQGPTDRIIAPCGKCYACLSNKRNEWSYRLGIEAKASTSAYFVTLTYADGLDDYGNVSIQDVQLFLKRFRKLIEPHKLRYYLVSEYGSKTFRPHYHALFFFKEVVTKEVLTKCIDKTWQKGFCQIGTVKQASIHYVTKYIMKKMDYPEGLVKPFAVQSRKPGLGIDYVHLNSDNHHLRNAYVTNVGGFKQSMPRYYKDKIYNKAEKAFIASNYTEKEKLSLEDYLRLNPFKKKNKAIIFVILLIIMQIYN